MFQHAANFAVLAFGNRHYDPLVRALFATAAFDVGVNLAVAHPVYGDAFHQAVQIAFGNVAVGARAIGSRNT